MTAILVRILTLATILSTFACKKDTNQKPATDVAGQDADGKKIIKLEDATNAEDIRVLRNFDTLSCGKVWEFKLVGLSLSMVGREGCKEVSKEETVTLTSEQRNQIVDQLGSIQLKAAAIAPCPPPSPETIISLVIAKKGYSYRSENCGEGGYVISDEDLDTTFKLFLRFHKNAPAP